MKKTSKFFHSLFTGTILIACLISSTCSKNSAKTTSPAPGLPALATVEGFPIYSDTLISAMIHMVDGTIMEQQGILKALLQLPQVQRCDWEGMKKTIAAFQESWGDRGIYWFALPSGRYYTVEKGLLDRTLNDRPYFSELLAGKSVAGVLVVSKSTGKKSTVTAMPILNAQKQMIGALGATMFLEKLDERLASALSLPEGTLFYALAKDGTTVLHQKLSLVFDNPLNQDSPTLKASAEKMLAAESGEVEYEFNGFRRTVRYKSSPLTGWRFAIGLNTAKL